MVLIGSAGSGKSWFSGQKIIIRCLLNQERILIVRKTHKSIRESYFRMLKEIIDDFNLNSVVKISNYNMNIKFLNGSEIIFHGLDNVEKLKSISSISSIVIEEASEICEADLNQISIRLRGKCPTYYQIIMNLNPIDINHFIKKRFVDIIQKDTIVHNSNYINNKFIDTDDYTKNLDATFNDPKFIQVYKEGIWGVPCETVFSNFTVIDYIPEIRNLKNIRFGQDFGFNDPSVTLKVYIDDKNVFILDEIFIKEKTNSELIEILKTKIDKNILTIGDCSEPDRIKEFQNNGFKIKACKKGKDSIKNGIDWLRNCKIYINKNCKETIKEFQLYSYKKDKFGNITDEFVDKNNHSIDALRYSVEDFIKPFKFNFSLGNQRKTNGINY